MASPEDDDATLKLGLDVTGWRMTSRRADSRELEICPPPPLLAEKLHFARSFDAFLKFVPPPL